MLSLGGLKEGKGRQGVIFEKVVGGERAAGCYLWEGRWNEEEDEGEKGRRWIFFLVYRVLSLRGMRGEERWWHTLYICTRARARVVV